MSDPTLQNQDRPADRIALYAALSALLIFVVWALWSSAELPFLFCVTPLFAVALIALAIFAWRKKRNAPAAQLLVLLVLFLAIAYGFLRHYDVVHERAMWVTRSHAFKMQVLAKPTPPDGTLKHIDWDAWGWGGMDTDVYLVFDPSDTLENESKERRTGNFTGIPCKVDSLRRMEDHWYSARFYTDETWEHCAP